jgi:hypothetical protein
MNATEKTSITRLKTTSMSGDYDLFSRFMEKGSAFVPAAGDSPRNAAARRRLRLRTTGTDRRERGSASYRL